MAHDKKRDNKPHDNENDVSMTDSLVDRLRTLAREEGGLSVVRRAIVLLEGGYEGESFLRVVGGSHAEGILSGAPALYWPELWGARALLYIWDDSAEKPVVKALGNQSWRVREMAAKVCAAREIGEISEIAVLTTHEHPRVRSAGARALAVRGNVSSVDTLELLLRDYDKEVRRTAQQSIKALRERLADAE
jgi:hypothetical protein